MVTQLLLQMFFALKQPSAEISPKYLAVYLN